MRYFIVMYKGNDSDGQSISGDASSEVEFGYLNRLTFEKDVCKKYGLVAVTITNIIELTESDFNFWINEKLT